jgi:hypothetical protein
MQKNLPRRVPERGGIYRDLDGQLVRLVNVQRNLCIWIPVIPGKAERQVTDRDYFLLRFKPLRFKTAA